MKVSELIDVIRKQDLVVPEFQREYVWSRDQAKQLMVSLIKEYPVGSLLFWKTDNPPELKNIKEIPEKLGTIQVIRDGQQRLTTLYLLITNSIPPYYKELDINTDPRDLYINLETGEFQYYQSERMKDNPLWRRVIDCFCEKDINVFEIAKQKASTDKEAFEFAQRYNKHLNMLQNIQSMDMPVQTVPSYAVLDEAIDIFDRVNSQGTKLTDAELALTHVTGKWPQARRIMKAKLNELEGKHFYFNLAFMTRALTGAVTQRALFETIHNSPRTELEKGWNKLDKILDYLINILPQWGCIHSTEDLNTSNVLVPVIVYLSRNEVKFLNEKILKKAIHWIYAAHIWARYTAQTDQRLEHDVALAVIEEVPWDLLCDQIIDQRGRIEVKASDLEGRWVQHPLYRMTLILVKAHNAVDWFNGAPLGITHGQAYRIHSHHIFPQSLLYKNGYDEDNHLHRKIINEIANRAFLTADTNRDISDELPERYLSQVEERYAGALVKQFIPMDPALWRVERFSDFLEARRALISSKINEFMKTLVSEPQIVHERSVSELIPLGESATLEFKSTLQWDVIRNCVNKDLHYSVLRTIAAFLNSEGGTLIIGVEDDGGIYGLENDLKAVNGSTDRFVQKLTSLISEYIGGEYAHLIKIRFETVEWKRVCIVDVDKAQEPIFLKGPRGKEFYIRFGSTTRVLDAEETIRYILMNWE